MTIVSVVIPHFNGGEWLQAAVDSVLAQTLRDFEMIIIDDGSEEPSSVIRERHDPRIRYVRQEHRGVSAARNRGVRLACGKFVAFLDADDLFLPEKLRVQVEQMEIRNVVMSHTSYRRMDVDGGDLAVISSGCFGGFVYPEILMQCPIATPTVMVRREALLLGDNPFDESLGIGEDTLLWTQLARHHEILGIDQALTRVRVHGHNAFDDPTAQYRGRRDVLWRALGQDPQLGFRFRRQALAKVCTDVALMYSRQSNVNNAISSRGRRHLLLAVRSHPPPAVHSPRPAVASPAGTPAYQGALVAAGLNPLRPG